LFSDIAGVEKLKGRGFTARTMVRFESVSIKGDVKLIYDRV